MMGGVMFGQNYGIVLIFITLFSMQYSEEELQMARKSTRQIMVRKMKHAGQVDREVRKNWKNLFKFMNQDRLISHPLNPERSPQNSPSPQRRIVTECSDSRIERQRSNPKKLTALHASLKYRRVQQRQRKNQQIFFKKRTQDVHVLSKDSKREGRGSAMGRRHSMQLQKRRNMEETLPFMLRRRTAKLEKEMGIIKHCYKDSLQKIETRQQLKNSLNLQQRQQLVNRMKGSKVYYQFLKEWRSQEQETI